MAEIENSATSKQCLARPIPKKAMMREETGAWSNRRNEIGMSADWQFQTEDARGKLRRLYPTIDD